mmetsp:Transcript_24619/g.48310  ORF Transcript_24619/g.48310 Transcript_24619/m.48310 type:complete len:148 (-) Transcript_24619:35-478(-)
MNGGFGALVAIFCSAFIGSFYVCMIGGVCYYFGFLNEKRYFPKDCTSNHRRVFLTVSLPNGKRYPPIPQTVSTERRPAFISPFPSSLSVCLFKQEFESARGKFDFKVVGNALTGLQRRQARAHKTEQKSCRGRGQGEGKGKDGRKQD